MKKNGWSCRLVAVSWVCLFVLGTCAQPVVSDGDKGVEAAAPALASEVAYARGAGRISLRIAEGWTYEIQEEADDGTFSIIFWSDEDPAGRMRVSYHETFGVCGTGLEQKEIQIGGYPAWQGTYDQKEVWDYIHIPDEDGDYVVYNENDGAWWEAHESEVMEMLKTLRIGTDA